jgi:surfeit locus 1 family protein
LRTPANSPVWQSLSVALLLAALLSLGFWQLQRRAWKEALILRIESRVGAPPLEAPPPADWAQLQAENYDWRHVVARGRFDFAHVALVFTSAPPGAGLEPGYRAISPLRLENGGVVLVDRGFVAASKTGGGAWRLRPEGLVTVTGHLRAPQRRNVFTPADEPGKGRWFTLDAQTIAGDLGLEGAAPFLLEQEAGQGKDERADGLFRTTNAAPDIPNNHLSYATTWFGLAFALCVIYVLYARARLRGR